MEEVIDVLSYLAKKYDITIQIDEHGLKIIAIDTLPYRWYSSRIAAENLTEELIEKHIQQFLIQYNFNKGKCIEREIKMVEDTKRLLEEEKYFERFNQ